MRQGGGELPEMYFVVVPKSRLEISNSAYSV
jgi:hypothetical protein